jgi:hypothetical protein
MVELGIEPGTSWLVLRISDHQTTRPIECISHQIWWVWFIFFLGIFLSRLVRHLAGLKYFIGKFFGFFPHKTLMPLLCTSSFGFHLLHSRRLPHASGSVLWFLLFEVLCSGDWGLITKQKATATATANFLSVVRCSTVSMVSFATLLQAGSSSKTPIFRL